MGECVLVQETRFLATVTQVQAGKMSVLPMFPSIRTVENGFLGRLWRSVILRYNGLVWLSTIEDAR